MQRAWACLCIDLKDATYFIAIAEAGNLALAAESTQPSLTKCIQRLEDDLR